MPEATLALDADRSEPEILVDRLKEVKEEATESGAMPSAAPYKRRAKRTSDVWANGLHSLDEPEASEPSGSNRPVRTTRKEVSYDVAKYYQYLDEEAGVAIASDRNPSRSSKRRKSSSSNGKNDGQVSMGSCIGMADKEGAMNFDLMVKTEEDLQSTLSSPIRRGRPSKKKGHTEHGPRLSSDLVAYSGHDEVVSSYDSLFDPEKSGGTASYESLFDPCDLSEIDEEGDKIVSDREARSTSMSQRRLKQNRSLDKRPPFRVSWAVLNGLIDQGKTRLIESGKVQYVFQWRPCVGFYRHVQQCRHCVSRLAGDSCRFLGMRALPITQDEAGIELISGQVLPPIFVGNSNVDELPSLPDHFDLNRAMDEVARRDIMTTAAISLIDVMREGIEHAQQAGCLRRPRELQIRAMCDYCSTGLFVASFMCQQCGSEYCLACKAVMANTSNEEQRLTQLCVCVHPFSSGRSKVRGANLHSIDKLMPVSRFSLEELQREAEVMQSFKDENGASIATSEMKNAAFPQDFAVGSVHSTHPLTPDQSDVTSIPSHKLAMHSRLEMDDALFLATWARGEPLVVNDVMTRNVWDPTAFIDKYGHLQCDIVRCDEQPCYYTPTEIQTKLKDDPHYFWNWERPAMVQDFFESFGKPIEERQRMFGKGVWKLKDWPPAAEFRTSFPDIYEDFQNVVPMPDYTRRDGCRNISALFPKNANGPDLGPKMYNAWPGEHSKGKKGTTCLHMDVADAVNILLYTEELESAEEQAAQWDIFRAEDADLIRRFLREREPAAREGGDPIHKQSFYLDDDALVDLYRQKGVYSWRILQRTGQAVFIPAGCAHQVCNLTDCIKVAVDFISPQNVARCFQLVEQFRGMSVAGRRSWKEDVLQLKAQLWYAWSTCRALLPAPSEADHRQGVERRQDEQRTAQSVKYERHSRRKLSTKIQPQSGPDLEGSEMDSEELKMRKRKEEEAVAMKGSSGKQHAKKVGPRAKRASKKAGKEARQGETNVESMVQKQYKEVGVGTDPDVIAIPRSQLYRLHQAAEAELATSSRSSQSESTRDDKEDSATNTTCTEEREVQEKLFTLKTEDGYVTALSHSIISTPPPRETDT